MNIFYLHKMWLQKVIKVKDCAGNEWGEDEKGNVKEEGIHGQKLGLEGKKSKEFTKNAVNNLSQREWDGEREVAFPSSLVRCALLAFAFVLGMIWEEVEIGVKSNFF